MGFECAAEDLAVVLFEAMGRVDSEADVAMVFEARIAAP
jgi:hypothetical protein